MLEESLQRCNADPAFLDRFYEKFLASSPAVREKFANTDFVRQKREVTASFHRMLLAAEEGVTGPDRYLKDTAEQHSKSRLDIGAELYDLWLDSLLATVKECDPKFNPEIEAAWETLMSAGIGYMLSHYHRPPNRADS